MRKKGKKRSTEEKRRGTRVRDIRDVTDIRKTPCFRFGSKPSHTLRHPDRQPEQKRDRGPHPALPFATEEGSMSEGPVPEPREPRK